MSDNQSEEFEKGNNSYSDSEELMQDYPDQVKSQSQNDQSPHQSEEEQYQDEGDSFKIVEDNKVIERMKEEAQLQPVAKEDRCTLDCISKYQFARVIGMRAQQISANSPLYIDDSMEELKGLSAIEIAQREFKAKRLPFLIRRVLPNGRYEDWALSELDNKNR